MASIIHGLFGILCLFLTLTFSNALHFRLKRGVNADNAEETPGSNDGEVDEVTVTLRAMVTVLGAFGSKLIEQIPGIQEKILNLYKIEMKSKSGDCQWTEKDAEKWEKKLEEVKIEFENSTDTDGLLGLEEYQKKKDLTPIAQYSLGVLEDMENFTRSIVLSEAQDFVILKYGAYLRERMIIRKNRLPTCFWTPGDRQRALKVIDGVVDQMSEETIEGVAKRLGIDVTDLFSPEDKEEFKKGAMSLKYIYEPLFDPLEED